MRYYVFVIYITNVKNLFVNVCLDESLLFPLSYLLIPIHQNFHFVLFIS